MPSMKPCDSAASSEPTKKARFHSCLWSSCALTRKSKATPRRISPTSMKATGRYSAAEDDAVRDRKGHQQHADAEHQPGFVGIPERADRRDHGVLVGVVGAAAAGCRRRGRSRRARRRAASTGPSGATNISGSQVVHAGSSWPHGPRHRRPSHRLALARQVEQHARCRTRSAARTAPGTSPGCSADDRRRRRRRGIRVRSTPVTSQGWRPISVTYQPASVASQPENVIATSARASQRGGSPRRRSCQAAHHDTSSISRPMPTITRKAQNTGATGGCASGNSLRPRTSPSRSWVRIRLRQLRECAIS